MARNTTPLGVIAIYVLLLKVVMVKCDIGLHTPRGSNNKLNEVNNSPS